MTPGSELKTLSAPTFLWTVFVGILLIRRGERLRGAGPAGRSHWLLLGCLGIIATVFWLSSSGPSSFGTLRGGNPGELNPECDASPPADAAAEPDGEEGMEQGYLMIPNGRLGGYFLVKKPFIKCKSCHKVDQEGLTWQTAGEYASWRDFVVLKSVQDPKLRQPAGSKPPRYPDRGKAAQKQPSPAAAGGSEASGAAESSEPEAGSPGARPRVPKPPSESTDGDMSPGKVEVHDHAGGRQVPANLKHHKVPDFRAANRPLPHLENLQSDELAPYTHFGHDPRQGYGQPNRAPRRRARFEGVGRSTDLRNLMGNIDSSKIKPESLTYVLFFTHLPGICMTGFTERRDPCRKDLEPRWISHGIWSADFRKITPLINHPEAHNDSKLPETQLIMLLNSGEYADLKSKLETVWPAYTITMRSPASFAYFNQAPMLQFAPELRSFKQYLTKVLELSEERDIEASLGSLAPDDDHKLPSETLENAFLDHGKAQLQCRRLSHGTMESHDEVKVLTKIGLCFTHDLKPKDCPPSGSCHKEVYYLADFEAPEGD